MRISKVVNTMEYELLECIECEALTPMRNGLKQPTLYEEGAKVVVEKMHNPKTMHDRQIHTNMPKSILTNVMMMDAIEEGLRKIWSGEKIEYDTKTKIVSIYRKMPNGEE